MADTKELEINTTWIEVTGASGLNMTDGEKYLMEFQSPSSSIVAIVRDSTDGTTTPADDAPGHVYYTRSTHFAKEVSTEGQEYMKSAGNYLWIKTNKGSATLVSTEI